MVERIMQTFWTLIREEGKFNWPNRLTYLRILSVPFSCVLISQERVFWAVVLFGLAAFSDCLDGILARKRNQRTKLGKFLDPIADKFLILAPLFFLNKQGLWLETVAIIYFREITIFMIRCLVINTEKEKAVSATGLAKSKTVVQCFCVEYVIIGWPYYNWIMLPAVIITVWSGWDYIKKLWYVHKNE